MLTGSRSARLAPSGLPAVTGRQQYTDRGWRIGGAATAATRSALSASRAADDLLGYPGLGAGARVRRIAGPSDVAWRAGMRPRVLDGAGGQAALGGPRERRPMAKGPGELADGSGAKGAMGQAAGCACSEDS